MYSVNLDSTVKLFDKSSNYEVANEGVRAFFNRFVSEDHEETFKEIDEDLVNAQSVSECKRIIADINERISECTVLIDADAKNKVRAAQLLLNRNNGRAVVFGGLYGIVAGLAHLSLAVTFAGGVAAGAGVGVAQIMVFNGKVKAAKAKYEEKLKEAEKKLKELEKEESPEDRKVREEKEKEAAAEEKKEEMEESADSDNSAQVNDEAQEKENAEKEKASTDVISPEADTSPDTSEEENPGEDEGEGLGDTGSDDGSSDEDFANMDDGSIPDEDMNF